MKKQTVSDSTSFRMLIIEDDEAAARSLEIMLRSLGYVCDCVVLGEDGLAIAGLYDYDLIILDLMLPDLDGCEIISRIRKRKKNTPIIVVSGVSDSEQKLEALKAGADDFVSKPFEKRELVARIEAKRRRHNSGRGVGRKLTAPLFGGRKIFISFQCGIERIPPDWWKPAPTAAFQLTTSSLVTIAVFGVLLLLSVLGGIALMAEEEMARLQH